MEILIRDSKTRLFLKDEATWVLDEDEARAFPVSLDGLKFCVEHELQGMELAFRYSSSPSPGHSKRPSVVLVNQETSPDDFAIIRDTNSSN